MPTEKKPPCVRAIITPDFLDYLEFYHNEAVQQLLNRYRSTLLPEGLEIEHLSEQDEELLENYYRGFVKHYVKNLQNPTETSL